MVAIPCGFDPHHRHHVGTDFAPFRFFLQKNQSHAPSFLLFRKKARSAHLFACKRAHNASLSLPLFCEFAFGVFYFFKNTASLLSAAAALFRKTYWVLRKYFAPCGALSYTIFKHYSKKCDTQNHAPHFSIHCSYYLIRYIIVIYLKSLSSRFKPFSIYPSRLPLILSAFAIARATDGFSAIISFKLNSSFERKNSTQVNECRF